MTADRRLLGDLGIGGPEPDDTASLDVPATMTADRPHDLDIEVPEPDNNAFCDA